MEWVETTAKTLEQAKDLALDKLGVDDPEAEFEILEEPRQGLFGRTRGEARVRARVRPIAPRPKEDRNRRRKRSRGGGTNDRGTTAKSSSESARNRSGGGKSSKSGNRSGNKSGSGAGSRARGDSGGSPEGKSSGRQGRDTPPQKEASMEEVTASVETFLTGLTAAFGLEAPVEISTDDEEILAQIQGKHGLLLGPKARTLDAIQELTRVTAQRTAPSGIRIKVDVGGYREHRRQALVTFAGEAAEKAVAEDVEVVLEPMSPADRKVVHDALSDHGGVSTRSAGADPRRRVVVVPAGAGDDGASTTDEAADEAAEADADV